MTSKPTIGAETEIETPRENVSTQEINPASLPASVNTAGDEVAAIEVSTCDISCVEVPEIDTLQMTLGVLRPSQGYLPVADLRQMHRTNDANGQYDLLDDPVAKDQEQLSLSLFTRGVNFINPMALPPVRAADVSGGAVNASALEALYFGSNGPSIATPGSAKRAAVEKSISIMRSQIVNAFNRDIPFSSMANSERALALRCYEGELGKLQIFFNAIDRLLGYAEWQAVNGVPIDHTWQVITNPDAYTALGALYKSVADLPIFDYRMHDRIDRLQRIFSSRSRVAPPATCMMQDIQVYEDAYKEGVTLHGSGGYSSNTCGLGQIIPNLSWYTVWRCIAADTTGEHFLALVQLFAQRATRIRTQYEMVVTALAQMEGRGAIALKKMSDYIPASVTEVGLLEFGKMQPVFSYAFHERFEYAPVYITEEDLGSNVKAGYWRVFSLPDTATRVAPSSCMGVRPVGLKHGKKAWSISEMIDIGLFKEQNAAEATADGAFHERMEGSTLTFSSGAYAAVPTLMNAGGPAPVMLLDAVYGDFYMSGVSYLASGYEGAPGYNSGAVLFHGMSFNPSGSGICNAISLPGIMPTGTGLGPAIGSSGSGQCNAFMDSLAGSDSLTVTTPEAWFLDQLAEMMDLHVLIINRVSASNVRLLAGRVMRGYADSGYYSMSISPVDNAIGKHFDELIPFMQYQRKPVR